MPSTNTVPTTNLCGFHRGKPDRHFSGDYPTRRPRAALGVSFTSPTKNADSGSPMWGRNARR